jgi:hypothetical protein
MSFSSNVTGVTAPKNSTLGTKVNFSTEKLPAALEESFINALAKLIPAKGFGEGVYLTGGELPSAPPPNTFKATV